MNEDCSRNESCTRTKYTYDALGQLSTPVTAGSSAYPKWGLQWTYDRYGNRLSQTATAGSPPQNSVTVNPNTNCLTGTGYSCDASGNMTGDGINTLTYDAENRVSTAAGPYGGATYTYDGNGLRVEKQVTGGTTTVYIFSGSKVIAEYDNGAALSLPQTPPSSPNACEQPILNAVNNQFGDNFTPADVGTGQFAPFTYPQVPGGTVNIDIFVPPQDQPDGVSPGRYPINWWTYIVGYGPTLHIPSGPGGLDSPSTLLFSGSQFTAHIDSAFPYNPFGLLIHFLKDVLGIGGHSPCP